MNAAAIVFLGAGLGGMLRHFINVVCARALDETFPGTLGINVFGSFAMGIIAAYDMSQHWRLFFAIGCAGGFTTMSSFAADSVLLYERGAIGLAAAYVAASVSLSIVALFAGLAVGSA